MSKLHELLAVESDKESTYKKVVEEAKVTFTKKVDHFSGSVRKLTMFDESKEKENLVESKEMVTTVDKKLDYVADFAINYFDVVLQKEKTNQIAKADLIVDGTTIATDLPATFLLGMETKLKAIRDLYEATPTLTPGYKWELDPNAGTGVFVTSLNDKLKSAKTFQHKILVPPTDKHPAQIEKWEEAVPVGKYTEIVQSGMLTPAQKSKYIGKIDKLIQACKQARQRANNVDVINEQIGMKLFDFITS